jgi:hypothetical protein
MISLQKRAKYSFIELFCSLITAKKTHGNQKVFDATILYIYITAFYVNKEADDVPLVY